jgi:hypothetical protein
MKRLPQKEGLISRLYLDSYVFRGGRRITVAGEIQGEKIKPLGQMDYRYPLLSSKQIYFWPEYYYRPIPTPTMTHGGVTPTGGDLDLGFITTTIATVNFFKSSIKNIGQRNRSVFVHRHHDPIGMSEKIL